MIGAGDVTEVKSGPAFKKVEGSDLVAVMRRDQDKVKDYAQRHAVAKWYTDAQALINDKEVNAIYIATPPDTHYHYSLMALEAGKAVYVEKPMTLGALEAERLAVAVEKHSGKLTVAHYRRAQPYFKKIKQLLLAGAIGKPCLVSLQMLKKPLSEQELNDPKIQWRLNASKSGGGLFHDLAPHQLDFIYHLFGEIKELRGISTNQAKVYQADDVVGGQILFGNDVLFNGVWLFNADEERDNCEIIGSLGRLSFSFFSGAPIVLINREGEKRFVFEPLQHVQQPMIAEVVAYLQGKGDNPCGVTDGLTVMRIMDIFTSKLS